MTQDECDGGQRGAAGAGGDPAGRAGVPRGGAGAVPRRRHHAARPARTRLQTSARLHALSLRQVGTGTLGDCNRFDISWTPGVRYNFHHMRWG